MAPPTRRRFRRALPTKDRPKGRALGPAEMLTPSSRNPHDFETAVLGGVRILARTLLLGLDPVLLDEVPQRCRNQWRTAGIHSSDPCRFIPR